MKENKNSIITNHIKELINNGIYKEGQLIESEIKLSEKFNVSRMTIRKALNELINEGLLYKEKNIGSFVSPQMKYSEFRLGVGFTEEVLKRGMIPSTKEATLELVEANQELSKNMKIPLNEKLWKVTRVRCADKNRIVYAEEYFLYLLCPELNIDIVNNSIYDYLEKNGTKFYSSDQKIEAISCPKHVAKKLEITEGSPVILMTLIVYSKNGTIFNCGVEYYTTDKFKLIQSVFNK